MNEKIIEKFEKVGGKHWQKDGKNRVYFNAPELAVFLGYEWSNYKTGNISSATKNGEKISNSLMKKVIDSLSANLYYDLIDNKFHWKMSVGIGRYESIENVIELLTQLLKKEKELHENLSE